MISLHYLVGTSAELFTFSQACSEFIMVIESSASAPGRAVSSAGLYDIVTEPQVLCKIVNCGSVREPSENSRRLFLVPALP